MTRAQRNHNPLNIRKGSQWLGIDPNNRDKAFVTFISDEYGFRAAFRILKNYMTKNPPVNTIQNIIIRWAPPSDGNPTQRYIEFVEKTAKIDRNTVLSYKDEKSMVAMVSAMAIFESGHQYPREVITQGYLLEKT